MNDSARETLKRKYWCFISYRHTDNAMPGRQWATWLHQQIETYEVPEDLIGTINSRGDEVPQRIFPVFRDEQELPADADLNSMICDALDHSRFLVVICSPTAVDSSYVAEEIIYYKKKQNTDRVLAAIIDGIPNISRTNPDTNDECFPEPLQYAVDQNGVLQKDKFTELLAADFRLPDGSQGWTSPEAYRQELKSQGVKSKQLDAKVSSYQEHCNIALLKIIAGILGIPLGELTERDKAYQLERERKRARFLYKVAATLIVLFLAAVAGGIFSWIQGDRANTEALNARKQAYYAQLKAAYNLIEQKELAAARDILLKVDLRSWEWEWAYLLSRCGASPQDLDRIHPDNRWLTQEMITKLRQALENKAEGPTQDEDLHDATERIAKGERKILASWSWRGGAHIIVFQGSPPTSLFTYWYGMYGGAGRRTLTEDGSVIAWESKEGGVMAGGKANLWTGDLVLFKKSLAPVPDRISFPVQTEAVDSIDDGSPPEDLLDRSYLVSSLERSTFSPLISATFGKSREVYFAWKRERDSVEEEDGEDFNKMSWSSYRRALDETPLYYEDRYVQRMWRDFYDRGLTPLPELSDENVVDFASEIEKTKIRRRFCNWFNLNGRKLAILEGNGLELWDIEEVKPFMQICKPDKKFQQSESDFLGSLNNAVQVKEESIAGWLNSKNGRFLGKGSIYDGMVDIYFKDSDGSRIPEQDPFPYMLYTSMAASPHGTQICMQIWGRNEQLFRVWDSKTGELIVDMDDLLPIGFGWPQDESFLAYVDSNGNLALHEDLGGRVIHEYPGIQVMGGFNMPVRYSPDRKRLLISNLIVDAHTFEAILLIKPGTVISEDWSTVVTWVDTTTAEISSLAFWEVLQGKAEVETLLWRDRLLLNEISKVKQKFFEAKRGNMQ